MEFRETYIDKLGKMKVESQSTKYGSVEQPSINGADIVNEINLKAIAESFSREKRKVHNTLYYDVRRGLIVLGIIFFVFVGVAASFSIAAMIAVVCFGISTLGVFGITTLARRSTYYLHKPVSEQSLHLYGKLKYKIEVKAQQKGKWIIFMNYLLIILFFVGGVTASKIDAEGELYVLVFTIIVAVAISAMIALDLNRYYWKIGAEIFMLAETVIDIILVSERLSIDFSSSQEEIRDKDGSPQERQTLDILALVFAVLAVCLLLTIQIHKLLVFKKFKLVPKIAPWVRADMLFLIFVLSDNADFLLICSRLLNAQPVIDSTVTTGVVVDWKCVTTISPKDILIATLLVLNPSLSEVAERKAQQRISTVPLGNTFLFQDAAKQRRNQKARESRKILVQQLKGGLQNKASAQLVWSAFLFFPLIMALSEIKQTDGSNTVWVLFFPTYTGFLWYICVQRLWIFREYFNRIFTAVIPSFFVGCWVLLLRYSGIIYLDDKCSYISVPMILKIAMATISDICREVPFRTIQSYDVYSFSELGTPPVVDTVRELAEEVATDQIRKPISVIYWKHVRKLLLPFQKVSSLSETLFKVCFDSRSVHSICFCMDTVMEDYSIARKFSQEDGKIDFLDGLLLKIAEKMTTNSEHFLPTALRIVEAIGNQSLQQDKTAMALMNIFRSSNIHKTQSKVNLELEGWSLKVLDLPSFLMKLTELKNHFISLNLEGCCLGADGENLAYFLQENETTVHLNLNSNHMGDSSFSNIAKVLGSNDTIKRINLHGNEVTGIVAQDIAEILKVNSVLETFDLGDNHLEHEGAQYIAAALELNKTLREISLCQNNIGDIGGEHVAKALEVNKTLETLNLADNEIGEASGTSIALALILQKRKGLQYLNLSNNPVGKLTGKTFACTLQLNTALRELFLDNCGIGDESSRLVASSLQKNTTLLLLSLRNNDIGSSSGKVFADMVGTNTCLQYLDLGYNCIGEAAKDFQSKLSKNSQLKHLDLTFNNIDLNVTKTLVDAVEQKTVSLEIELSLHCTGGFESLSLIPVNRFLDGINTSPIDDLSKSLRIPKGVGFVTLYFLPVDYTRPSTADRLKVGTV